MSHPLIAALYAPHDAGADGGERPSAEERARDHEWVHRIALDDERAFEAMFRAYAAPLIRYAQSYTGDPVAAQELVSDVLTSVWDHRRDWSPAHGVATYLYGAVRNRALNHERSVRRRARLAERAALEPEPPGVGVASESLGDDDDENARLLERVRRAVAALPQTRREAMILRWEHQMSAEQIADVMGLTRTAVYHLLTRSLQTLRELLGPELR